MAVQTAFPEEVWLILPNQLYENNTALKPSVPVVLLEEYLFFSQYSFHKKKIVLHRASMKAWAASREKEGFSILYQEVSSDGRHDVRNWIANAAAAGLKKLYALDPADDWLSRRISKACQEQKVDLQWFHNPGFLNSPADLETYFAGKKHFHQTDFYIAQRKLRGLLLEKDGKPIGGKWTFDKANRERLPKNESIPKLPSVSRQEILSEALLYTERFFPGYLGDTTDFNYPYTRKDALKWLNRFLDERLEKFGIYEDAMVASEHYLFHAVLTPMLNVGLLTPEEIVDATINKAGEKQIPINSLEGFIRQIVGWREFIRGVYITSGRKQRTLNYWGFKRKIPQPFYNGSTGIIPVDIVIKKLLKTAYNHHIERLMVLGNFFLLCEFDPDEVYRWFMEMYIDAYDWVMVPNVYGMTQFADGGLMTTKPYISGSNYLMKMGDWPKGNWQQVWDGLFWRFMHVHRDFFLQNPRLGMLVKTFDNMSEEKKAGHLNQAAEFLQTIDQWNQL